MQEQTDCAENQKKLLHRASILNSFEKQSNNNNPPFQRDCTMQTQDEIKRRDAEGFARFKKLDPEEVWEIYSHLELAGWQFPFDFLFWSVPETMSGETVLEILKTSDIPHLREKYTITRELFSAGHPFFTLDELDGELDFLIEFLQSNERFLVMTGYPETDYARRFSFGYIFRRLYPTKLPLIAPWPHIGEIKFDKWGVESSFAGYSDSNDNIKYGYYWESNKAYTSDGNPVTLCDYQEAALLPGLNPALADDVSSLREKLLRFYVSAIQDLNRAIADRQTENLYNHWFAKLTKCFHQDEIRILDRMNSFYDRLVFVEEEPLHIFRQGHLYENDSYIHFLGLTSHVESEIAVGMYHKIKTALMKYPFTHYLETYGQNWQPEVDQTLSAYEELKDQNASFQSDYTRKVNYAVKHYFYVRFPYMQDILIPLVHVEDFKQRLKDYALMEAQHLKIRGRLTDLPSDSGQNQGAEKSLPKKLLHARFPSPPGLRWEEVVISFVSNDSIKIQAQGTSVRFTFAEIGFKDGRKGDLPDSLWIFFRDALAANGGEIRWKTKLTGGQRGKEKAKISELRRRLKMIIEISDDPFFPYRKTHAYKTKFTLIDARFGNDQDQ
ncbi:MAG: hypothetical protein C4524_11510 [Candidatus Zixiibacteriota bacterium]|nr:MAG: hypothetical protein C4524_11510 [candidate division Zixibacteria bacterium]